MADVDALKGDLDGLRTSVNAQLEGMRKDIKDLTSAFRDLVRIDGDIQRTNDALVRIGRQVDDHEERLRSVENSQAADQVRIGSSERMFWVVFSAVVGVATFLLTD